jgi:hypothetical protein
VWTRKHTMQLHILQPHKLATLDGAKECPAHNTWCCCQSCSWVGSSAVLLKQSSVSSPLLVNSCLQNFTQGNQTESLITLMANTHPSDSATHADGHVHHVTQLGLAPGSGHARSVQYAP